MLSNELNIRSSINTDSIAEDTWVFTDTTAPLLQNTGIERSGGICNLWESETVLQPNSANYVAPSGETITKLNSGNVLVEGQNIGVVSPYGVQIRDTIANVDDVILSTVAQTYITATIAGKAVTITEYYTKDNTIVTENIPSAPLFPSTTLVPSTALYPAGLGGAPVHQRTIAFPSLLTTLYTSLSFVRTARINWYDNFKFALRQGDSVSILQEYTPANILSIPSLLTGFNELNYLFVYQFENSAYFVNLVGNSNNQSFIIDSSFSSITQTLSCRYAMAQVYNNKSRMLISCNPVITSHTVKAIGYVGYYDFINFNATEQWIGPTNNGTADGYDQPTVYNVGYGYSEYIEKKTGLKQYYNFNAPAFDYNTTIQYNFHQSQNKTALYNYYGKLTNVYTLTPSVPFEFRVCWINGVQSYLSVALIDRFPADHLGVMITEFGSFSDTYSPLIAYDNTLLYKNGDSYYIIVIDTYTDSTIPQIQQISASAFKINTISPINIVDLPSRTLLIGSSDYNGRMAFNSTATISYTKTRAVSTYTGKYSNGVDGGEKLLDIANPTSANIEVIGYRVDGLQTFGVDTYIALPPGDSTPIYAFSTQATGAELIDPNKTDTPYLANTILPLALGDAYNQNVATTVDSTIFYNTTNPISVGSSIVAGTSIGYDGYTLGNDIPGIYTAFRLQGQQYLQDANYIYKVNIANDIYQNKYIFAPSVGLHYIAASPTVVYFYSSFDNSLYTFTGGSTLDKGKRMNSLEAILNGVFSIRDNTLLLNTANTLIWARDGLFSLNNKKSNQIGALLLYETAQGITLLNNSYKWRYTYKDPTVTPAIAGTTISIVPLHLQTAYLGMENNIRSVITEWVITIYNENRAKSSLILTLYIQDLDGRTKEQQKFININPQDYTEGTGYARISFKPSYLNCLRASLSIRTGEKIQIQSIVVTYQPTEQALVSSRRSR